MTSKQPPRIATWMLKHFGSGPNNDVVLGDLSEQYRQKDSAMWYWRQVMSGIVISFFTEVRGHKRIAAKVLLTGWGMWILGGMVLFPLAFLGTNLGYDFQPLHPIGTTWSFMWMPVLGPAGAHGSLYYALAVGLPLIVGAVCGWLVARFYREQQTVAVLLFAGSILVMDLLLFAPFMLTVG